MINSQKFNAAISSCVFFSTILLGNTCLAQDAVGRNSAIQGTVTIQSIGQDIRAAAIRDDIFLGDDIGSEVDSSLQILLLDETVFTVGASAQLTIDEFVYDPNSNGNRMSASIKKGMFRFMSGNVSQTDPQNVELNTPVASLGIRGTIVEGFVGPEAVNLAIDIGLIEPTDVTDPDGASFIVLRGPGPLNGGGDTEGLVDVLTASGTVRLDTPGEAVFVQDPNVEPEVFDLPVAAFQTFSAQIRSAPSGPPSARPVLGVPNMPRALPPPPPPTNPGVGPAPGGPRGPGAPPGGGNLNFDPLVDIDGAVEEPEDEDQGCTFSFECTGEPEQ